MVRKMGVMKVLSKTKRLKRVILQKMRFLMLTPFILGFETIFLEFSRRKIMNICFCLISRLLLETQLGMFP